MSARAQQAAMPVIGFLSGRSFDDSMEMMTALGQGLNEQGFAEHQNLKIEYRWADGHYDRLPALAADLVRSQVAVIRSGSTLLLPSTGRGETLLV
jgi:putative tryptophan/tyrosine transport system substrate-binding protein